MSDADEFDAVLESEPAEIVLPPAPQVGSRMANATIKDLICNPEVARLLVSGVPIREVAEQLGVSPGTVRKWMNRFEMSDLLKIESRRVMRHLMRRDLSKEKYLPLATAVAVMVDKAKVIEDGVSDQPTTISQTFIQKINIALYGQGSGIPGSGNRGQITEIDKSAVRELPNDTEAD